MGSPIEGATKRAIKAPRITRAEQLQQQLESSPAQQFYGPFHEQYVGAIARVLEGINLDDFARAVDAMAITAGTGQILTFGNGGTHTIADHLAHNFNWDASNGVSRGEKLSARCLSAEAAEVTARGNDRSIAFAFSTQLDNHARSGDVVVAFSGSGNSDNIVKAFRHAQTLGGITTIFIGPPNSKAAKQAMITIGLESSDQQIVEDAMTPVMHMLVRALKVRLGGLDQEALLQDVASLRTKHEGIRDLSAQLGAPVEITAWIERDFRRALSELAAKKIALAAQTALQPGRRDHIDITQIGTEFSSFTQFIRYAGDKLVGKVEFGATTAQLMKEYGQKGAPGLVDIFLRPNTTGAAEYARNEALYAIIPDLIPKPRQFIDGVAFYQYIEGTSITDILNSDRQIPFHLIGEELRRWHREITAANSANGENAARLLNASEGKHDTTIAFQEYFGTDNSTEATIRQLFDRNHLGKNDIDLIADIFSAAAVLNRSHVMQLPRDTWSHGNFQPSNIILRDSDEKVAFIDNATHLQPAIVDVAKMISRTLALGMREGVAMDRIASGLQEFVTGYYGAEPVPYQQIADLVAMDLLATLGKYASLTPSDLTECPSIISYVISHPRTILEYITALTNTQHTSLESLIPNVSVEPQNN